MKLSCHRFEEKKNIPRLTHSTLPPLYFLLHASNSFNSLDHEFAAASEVITRKQSAAGTARSDRGIFATYLAVPC
jgi:hypothetical protein